MAGAVRRRLGMGNRVVGPGAGSESVSVRARPRRPRRRGLRSGCDGFGGRYSPPTTRTDPTPAWTSMSIRLAAVA